MKKKLITKGDVIFMISAFLFGVILLIMMRSFMHKGKRIKVSIDGKVVLVASLEEDKEYSFDGYNGGFNTVVVKNNKAYIKEADCPDRLCVKQGKISKTGETIICLPHRLIVEVIE